MPYFSVVFFRFEKLYTSKYHTLLLTYIVHTYDTCKIILLPLQSMEEPAEVRGSAVQVGGPLKERTLLNWQC